MKKKYLFMMLLGLVAIPSLAYAEMISGTITSIDMTGNKITLLRSDTQDSVTVKVRDAGGLANLQTGSTVSLDANRKLFGGWEAKSLDLSGNANANTLIGASNNPSDLGSQEQPQSQAPNPTTDAASAQADTSENAAVNPPRI